MATSRFGKSMTVLREEAHKESEHIISLCAQKGRNVIGKGPELPDKKFLMKSNEALAEPRNDPRFKDINSMHPKRTNKFSGKY